MVRLLLAIHHGCCWMKWKYCSEVIFIAKKYFITQRTQWAQRKGGGNWLIHFHTTPLLKNDASSLRPLRDISF